MRQVFDSFDAAWTWEQNERNLANRVIQADKPELGAVPGAIARLEALLRYLEDPRVKALLAPNKLPVLRWQLPDVHGDLVCARGLMRDAEGVARSLDAIRAWYQGPESPLRFGYASVSIYSFVVGRVEGFKGLDSVRKDPRVLNAVRELRKLDTLRHLSTSAFASDYQPRLSEDERISGLTLFWAEVRQSFANFDLVPDLDWNAAYRAFLPRVRAASDTLSYYYVLQEFCALLQDGHTNVYLPEALSREVSVRPPLALQLAEGRVFVRRVASKKLEGLGITPGMELVAIDGEPTRAYGERVWSKRTAASTPQNHEVVIFVYDLLRGKAGKPVRLTLADASGKRRDVLVPRDPTETGLSLPPYELTDLPGGRLLVTLRGFDTNLPATQFEKDLPRILACKGLLLDIRDNGGGNSTVGWDILAHLTDKAFATTRWESPSYPGAYRAWGRIITPVRGEAGRVEPAEGPHFLGPVALLIGPKTFSAAEDMAVVFDVQKRGMLIGSATGGSTGQPLSFSLPGGGRARVCTKRDRYPDGREFVGKGVQPTHLVPMRAADLLRGEDTVLQAALRLLSPSSS